MNADCVLSLLGRPIADPDGRTNELSATLKAMTVDFLRRGAVPEATRSLADPDFVTDLVQLGALRLDHEGMTVAGVEPVEDRRLLAERLTATIGTTAAKRARKPLAADPALGFDDLVRAETIAFATLPELIVGLAGAQGGLAIADDADDCTENDRSELRRRISDAITDWAAGESATISANFENGRDGLTLFVAYLDSVGESVEEINRVEGTLRR
jgi:hypothetical protein